MWVDERKGSRMISRFWPHEIGWGRLCEEQVCTEKKKLSVWIC